MKFPIHLLVPVLHAWIGTANWTGNLGYTLNARDAFEGGVIVRGQGKRKKAKDGLDIKKAIENSTKAFKDQAWYGPARLLYDRPDATGAGGVYYGNTGCGVFKWGGMKLERVLQEIIEF